MDDKKFPTNSYKPKDATKIEDSQDKAEVTKIAKGAVTKRKKSLGEKFATTFVASELDAVKTHILWDVVVPTIRETIYNVINGAAGMIFLNGAPPMGRSPYRSVGGGQSRMTIQSSYQPYYDQRTGRPQQAPENQPQPKSILEEWAFASKMDAQDILDQMRDHIQTYNNVTVAIYYSFAGVTSTNYAADNYGWYNLDEVGIIRTREGYVITLPRPVVIDR